MTWWTPRSTTLQNFIALRQPTPDISVTKIRRTHTHTQTSRPTPVVRTGVYPHMPIAVTTVVKDTFGSVFSNTRYKILCMYSCRIVYDSSRHRLRHPPSPRNTKKFTTLAVTDHAAACFSQQTRSATVGQVCRTWRTSVERVFDFSIFDLGAYP